MYVVTVQNLTWFGGTEVLFLDRREDQEENHWQGELNKGTMEYIVKRYSQKQDQLGRNQLNRYSNTYT